MYGTSDGGSGARSLCWNSHVVLDSRAEVNDERLKISTRRYIQAQGIG